MTDGQMAPNIDIYGMYGLEHYDWRGDRERLYPDCRSP